jgi:hypothetical protein
MISWFHFAGNQERVLILAGTIMEIGAGAGLPLIMIAFTNFGHVNEFGLPDPLITSNEFQSKS